MQKFFRQSILIFGIICLLVFIINAQNPVSLSITVTPNSVSAGGNGTAKVTANISGGWYIYSITQAPGGPNPTRVSLATGGPFQMGAVSGPKPKVKFGENFKMETQTYAGSATFNIRFGKCRCL